MLTRLIAIVAILHGTVFLGTGNALEHLVHQMQANESGAHSHHHHHKHHHQQKGETSSDAISHEEWMNCVFCLDGLMGTPISIAWLDIEFAASTIVVAETLEFSPSFLSGFYARAPPILS